MVREMTSDWSYIGESLSKVVGNGRAILNDLSRLVVHETYAFVFMRTLVTVD